MAEFRGIRALTADGFLACCGSVGSASDGHPVLTALLLGFTAFAVGLAIPSLPELSASAVGTAGMLLAPRLPAKAARAAALAVSLLGGLGLLAAAM